MAKTVAFLNMKGGVGKTTLTVNLGYCLAKTHAKRVLLVDVDPQFNASQYLMTDAEYLSHRDAPDKHTVLDIFRPARTEGHSLVSGSEKSAKSVPPSLSSCRHVVLDAPGKLHLIPSTLDLFEIENSARMTENRLHSFLTTCSDAYDYIFVDCPPTVSIYSQAALLASDHILVPVKPDPLSVIGLPLLERWMAEYCSIAGKTVKRVGIVCSLVRSPTPNQMIKTMQELRDIRKGEVFSATISQRTDVATSVEEHRPIVALDEANIASQEFEAVAKEFLSRIEKI